MDKLTAETGFSKAIIYRYFKSKECFFSETLSHYSKKIIIRKNIQIC